MKTATMILQSSLALMMSFGITAGSMYVTVSAKASNVRGLIQELEIESIAESSESIGRESSQIENDTALRAVSVELSPYGSLVGRISSIDPASGELEPTEDTEVTIITRNGRELTTTSEGDGTFTFSGLTPGAYTINAIGQQGRLSFGMRVIRNQNAMTDEVIAPVPVNMEVQLDAALAPSRDMQQLTRLLSGIEVEPVSASGEFDDEAALGSAGDDAGDDSLSSPGQQLYIDENGTFDGQLTLMDPGTGNIVSVRDLDVRFLQSNAVVASTSVNADGSFTQNGLEPGIYTMLIAGADGIAYMGVDVVSSADATATQYRRTSRRLPQRMAFAMVQGAGASSNGDGSNGGDGDAGAVPTPPPPAGNPPSGNPPAGGGGGGSIGGGGPGGGEGLGSLLTFAAIGAGVWALTDDDNNVPRPASPAN